MTALSAFVTGGASGIGEATALRLADNRYSVAICDRDLEGAKRTAEQILSRGGRAVAIALDVTDPASVDTALEQTCRELGTPTAVFASAGIMRVRPFLDLPLDQWEQTVRVNLTGTFVTVQRCGRAMVDAAVPGGMVVVASVAARGPRADAADYAASKAGVVSLVQSAAVALAPHGIRVNAVCPGVVNTAMTRRNAEKRATKQDTSADEVLDSLVSTVPLRRAAAPEEIADIALHLLGNDFGYVTGQALNVCGGLEFN